MAAGPTVDDEPFAQDVLDASWHALDAGDTMARLGTGPGGLDDDLAQRRRERFGRNVVPARPPVSLAAIVLHQFLNPLIYILLIAVAISLAIGKHTDAVFILIVIVVNAALGAFQEWRAERSAEALQQMLRITARVVRSGRTREVDAEELVPGDVVVLESGDRVPADLRLMQVSNLKTDESFLTGESRAAWKQTETLADKDVPTADQRNLAFAGATVVGGRGRGVVVATGQRTEIGQIAEAVTAQTAAVPPLMIRMHKFVRNISFIVIGAAVVLAGISWWQGRPFEEVFFLAVALAVSAIPEGLPVAMTVALSVAVYRMSRRHVIVRRMPAVEGLGSCTYLASDKTGTLTVNKQTVKLLWLPGGRRYCVSGEGYDGVGEVTQEQGGAALDERSAGDVRLLARASAISNDAGLSPENRTWKYHGDPLEVALLSLAFKAGLDPNALRREIEVPGEIPFDSERKYAAKFYTPAPGTPGEGRGEGPARVALKGAVERVAGFCATMRTADGEAPIDREGIEQTAVQLAEEGYRVLAIADGEMDAAPPAFGEQHLPPLRLLGLVGMIDPLRPEAKPAVKSCHEAGVEVAMITGDHPATAAAISRQIGIIHAGSEVVTGAQLAELDPDSRAFDDRVRSAHVFARVAPLQKLHIVESLNRNGHFTAVTGDGVNDAPALRRANIGVAMGSGTDVAKDAAPIIVTDDNFASIVRGIQEGRFAYDNIRKVIYLLVSTGAAEIVLFLLAILGRLPLPLLPVQILWLNLVTNGIQDKALAFEAGESEAMKRPPRKPAERIFNPQMLAQVGLSGAWMGLVCFVLFVWLIRQGWAEESARNVILLLMVLFQNFHLFNARSEQRSVFGIPPGRNWFLLLGAAGALALHLAVMQMPLMQRVLGVEAVSWQTFGGLLLLAATVLGVMELFKLIRRKLPAGAARTTAG